VWNAMDEWRWLDAALPEMSRKIDVSEFSSASLWK
jgi:hypothetical protein